MTDVLSPKEVYIAAVPGSTSSQTEVVRGQLEEIGFEAGFASQQVASLSQRVRKPPQCATAANICVYNCTITSSA